MTKALRKAIMTRSKTYTIERDHMRIGANIKNK